MFAHVYFRSKLSNLDEVYICTDNVEDRSIVEINGNQLYYDKQQHKNGTERCAEAVTKLELKEE